MYRQGRIYLWTPTAQAKKPKHELIFGAKMTSLEPADFEER
jgi:hypothetical protein